MKYTVVIRQAVLEEQRAQLEALLTERFGLNPEQSQRLASRGTGRLMKPTSRARAELLMNMFLSVGAEVALESVRDETSLITQPFQEVAPTPAFLASDSLSDDAPLAPARTPGPFGNAQPAWPSAPAAASLAGPLTGPLAGLSALSGSPQPAAGLPGLAAAALLERPAPPESSPAPGPLQAFPEPSRAADPVFSDSAFADIAPRSGPEAPPVTAPELDVWTDFTGALTLHDLPAPERKAEATVMPMLLSGADEPGARRSQRQSLARRLLLGTLLPLGLATGLTLLLLSALLPRLQAQIVQDQAQTLAAALGTTLTTGSQNLSNLQLDTILKDRNVAFVRIEKPGGSSYLRSKDQQVNDAWNRQVAQWTARHPERGTMRLDGASFVVTRLSVVENAIGQPTAVPVSAEKGTLIHRVTVGLRNDRFTAVLRDTIGLVIVTALFSLLVASIVANRTARAVVQPIEQLVKAADAISMGDLSRPVTADRNDEIGDLAQALERMRLSLESALERLRRRKRE